MIDHLKFIALRPDQTFEDVVLGLKVMARRLGCCVIVISHDEALLRKSADAIWQLSGEGDERVLTATKHRRSASTSELLSFAPEYGLFSPKKASPAQEIQPQTAGSLF